MTLTYTASVSHRLAELSTQPLGSACWLIGIATAESSVVTHTAQFTEQYVPPTPTGVSACVSVNTQMR